MGFKCQICNESVKQKTNKLVTQIRKVIYNTPCRDINDYNNSDKITTGSEIVKEIICCSKCFKEHEEDVVVNVGPEKKVFNKLQKSKDDEYKTKRKHQNPYNRNRDRDGDKDEYAEKYGE